MSNKEDINKEIGEIEEYVVKKIHENVILGGIRDTLSEGNILDEKLAKTYNELIEEEYYSNKDNAKKNIESKIGRNKKDITNNNNLIIKKNKKITRWR